MKTCLIAPLTLALLLAGATLTTARAQSTDDEAPPPPGQESGDDTASSTAPEQPYDDATSDEGASTDANGGRRSDRADEASEGADQSQAQQPPDEQKSSNDVQIDRQGGREQRGRSRSGDASRQYDRQDRDPNRAANDTQDDPNAGYERQESDLPAQETDRDSNGEMRGGRMQPGVQGEINVQDTSDLGLDVQEADNGLSITNIQQDSVLVQSGLRPGDIIVSVQQSPVRTSRDFVRWFRNIDRQANIPIVVLRDGRRQTIYLTGADVWRWYDRFDWFDRGDSWGRDARGQSAYLGVVFDDRYPQLALVEVVRRNTAADRAGLRAGDVISRINGQRVYGMRHATQLVSEMSPGEEIELEYSRRTTARANTRLGSRPDNYQAAYRDAYGDNWYSDDSDYGGRYDDGAMRTSYEEDFYPQRVNSERDGLLRRGDGRPFRNP